MVSLLEGLGMCAHIQKEVLAVRRTNIASLIVILILFIHSFIHLQLLYSCQGCGGARDYPGNIGCEVGKHPG